MHLLDGLHCPANSKALTGQLMKTTITLRLLLQGPLLGEAGGEQRVCESWNHKMETYPPQLSIKSRRLPTSNNALGNSLWESNNKERCGLLLAIARGGQSLHHISAAGRVIIVISFSTTPPNDFKVLVNSEKDVKFTWFYYRVFVKMTFAVCEMFTEIVQN